jgi:hypothetical protein
MEMNTTFLYFIIYVALFFTGPGKNSLDTLFSKKIFLVIETIKYLLSCIETSNVDQSFNSSTFVH